VLCGRQGVVDEHPAAPGGFLGGALRVASHGHLPAFE